MNNFIFGVENYCSVKFIGDDDNPKRYYWFSNVGKIMLKNGFDLNHMIQNKVEVNSDEIVNLNNYFEIEYDGSKRYFIDLILNTFILNKREFKDIFIPVDILIKEKRKFLFLIDSGDFVSIKNIHLSDKILNSVKSGLCKIVLNTSYEPYSQEQKEFTRILNDFTMKYNLNYNSLKIISGNLIVKNNPNDRYEFIPYCYFLEHPWFVSKDVFPTDIYYEEGRKKISENFRKKREEYINENRNYKIFDKKILCYNRRPHPHRRFLFYKLYNDDIIKNNIFLSLNNEEPLMLPYKYLYNVSDEESNNINSFYINNRKKWTFDGRDLNINLATNFDEYYHKNTFLSLVSETSTNRNVVFFSEKMFKPIYACQPFIICGNANSLKKLKEFGFKTFDKWWDESYDLEENFENRLYKIMNILREISNKTNDELYIMLNEMEDILVENYNVFTNANNGYFYDTFNSIDNDYNKKNKKLI